MKIPNRQIGWSQEAILLHSISKQLAFVYGLTSAFPRGVLPLEVNATNKTVWNNGPGDIDSNTAMGVGFYSNTTGYDNSSYGREALSLNTDGYQNTVVGMYAFQITPSGKLNTAIGGYALIYNSSGDGNTAFGISAAGLNGDLIPPILGTGINNVAIGGDCLGNLTSGIGNTVAGVVAMEGNPFPGGVPDNPVSGSYNIGMGFECDITLSTGNNNVMFEIGLGQEVEDGSRNIVINPRQAGLKSSNNNVCLGGASSVPDLNGQIIIGTGAFVRRIWFDTNGLATITTAPTNGGGVATEKVILLDAVSDANGMANIKTIDYIDTNATTTLLTLANLNAAYPGASIGFRVNCTAIVGTPKIYTKVSTTAWCSEAITNVA